VLCSHAQLIDTLPDNIAYLVANRIGIFIQICDKFEHLIYLMSNEQCSNMVKE